MPVNAYQKLILIYMSQGYRMWKAEINYCLSQSYSKGFSPVFLPLRSQLSRQDPNG